MSELLVGLAVAVAAVLSAPAFAACPDAVREAVMKAFPDGSIAGCEQAREDGRKVFEVDVSRGRTETIEVEVAPDGTIL